MFFSHANWKRPKRVQPTLKLEISLKIPRDYTTIPICFGIWSSFFFAPFGHFNHAFKPPTPLGTKMASFLASNRPKKDSTQEVHLATELVMKKPSKSETKTLLLMLTGWMPAMFPHGDHLQIWLVVKNIGRNGNLPQISQIEVKI